MNQVKQLKDFFPNEEDWKDSFVKLGNYEELLENEIYPYGVMNENLENERKGFNNNSGKN